MENAGDGIVIIHDGRVLFVNPGATRIMGVRQEDVVGASFLDVIHPEDRERILGYYLKRMRGARKPPPGTSSAR